MSELQRLHVIVVAVDPVMHAVLLPCVLLYVFAYGYHQDRDDVAVLYRMGGLLVLSGVEFSRGTRVFHIYYCALSTVLIVGRPRSPYI